MRQAPGEIFLLSPSPSCTLSPSHSLNSSPVQPTLAPYPCPPIPSTSNCDGESKIRPRLIPPLPAARNNTEGAKAWPG
ncbi:hypothetical protein E2C01_082450 [Portunus trituberculatus]|uniref:Uncharacterized protein n=1 Tax=Portunus trituberculatus TaxID=210409 RepID=A0A5B7J4Z7_PORTR|nr:hypothetical protein [Portunus trituberculatus]